MVTELARTQAPEAQELERKRAELATLELELARCELDLITLQAELNAFERSYLRIMGVRLAKLDEIGAEIADIELRKNPRDPMARERAARAHAQAKDSAGATGAAQHSTRPVEFRSPDRLRKLYREVAKRVHPDLATDPRERARRTALMAEANRAYEEGDEARLQAILHTWDASPETVKGHSLGAELVRVIRQIYQVKQRLAAIRAEMAKLRASDLCQLKMRVHEAASRGQDLLQEMAAQLDERIDLAQKRLAMLKLSRA